MIIVLASTSAIKVAACQKAFSSVADCEIRTVKADSGVNEQPMNGETLRGAFNRLNNAKQMMPAADYYISIENGIFEEKGQYIDRAVVSVMDKQGVIKTAYSDGVEFPKEWVEETGKRGFEQWTVGKVMEENGIVAKHDDPHLTLSGKSRVDYLDQAASRAVMVLRQSGALKAAAPKACFSCMKQH
jgi:inosine/xanthosine triphosphatase